MHCKNCGAPLEDDAGFCSYCGARVIDERLSTKFIFKEILDKVLSVDNKLLKTFIHLFTKPNEVINGYISGIRKRYYNPFSYLLISLTFAGLSTLILRDYTMDIISATSTSNANEAAEAFTKKMMDFIYDYQSIIAVITIPIYAFISWLVFLNRRKFNYLEHHIIYLYTSAHISILSSLLVGLIFILDLELMVEVSLGTSFTIVAYNAYVLIRLFKLSFWQFIVKTLYFIFILITFYLMFLITMLFIIFMIGGTEALKQFTPRVPSQDSIQNIKKTDSVRGLKQVDSIKLQQQDNVTNDPKTISFYDASSKLNCFS